MKTQVSGKSPHSMDEDSRYPQRTTRTAIRLPLKIRTARRTTTLRRRLRSPPPRIPLPLPLHHQRARHRPHARRRLQYRHRHPLAPHQLQPPRPLLPLLPQSPRKRAEHGSTPSRCCSHLSGRAGLSTSARSRQRRRRLRVTAHTSCGAFIPTDAARPSRPPSAPTAPPVRLGAPP